MVEKFGIIKVKLVVGWSMGAQQTNQWGCLYPEMVERIAPFCGSAKTTPHNFVFLEGVKAALTNDVAFNGGWYDSPPNKGLRGVGRGLGHWRFWRCHRGRRRRGAARQCGGCSPNHE